MLRDIKDWPLEKKVKVIPPTVGVGITLITVVAFPGEIGMLGVSILFALLISFTPYSLYGYFITKRIRSHEDQFPNFLRDLVESKKSGMTLPQAIKSTSKNEYGKLSPQIRKMNNQIALGVSFEEVLDKFANRMEGSKLIQRSIRIIINAQKSGGDLVSTMETIASDAATIKEMEKEKKSKMQQHSMVMYLIYFMFLGITVILSKVLIPMTEMGRMSGQEGGLGVALGGGGGICIPIETTTGIQNFVCSFFLSMSEVFGLGTGMGGYYKGLFLSMILIEGIFSGLIIGQISNNSPSAGIKHSLILTGVGFTAFLLTVKMGII